MMHFVSYDLLYHCDKAREINNLRINEFQRDCVQLNRIKQALIITHIKYLAINTTSMALIIPHPRFPANSGLK